MQMSSNFLIGPLICPHCGTEIRNARKICPDCRNNIEDAQRDNNQKSIIGGVSATIGMGIAYFASKLGIKSDLFLLAVFVVVFIVARPIVRKFVYKS